jgi:hypothetical protein
VDDEADALDVQLDLLFMCEITVASSFEKTRQLLGTEIF